MEENFQFVQNYLLRKSKILNYDITKSISPICLFPKTKANDDNKPINI